MNDLEGKNVPAFHAANVATLLSRRRLLVLRGVGWRRRISLLGVSLWWIASLWRISRWWISVFGISLLWIPFISIQFHKTNRSK
jgi:hypothetical protein